MQIHIRRSLGIAFLVAVLSVPLALAACGGGGGEISAEANPEGTTPAPSVSEAGTSTPAEASFDQAFIDAMVAHHEQAIEMVRVAADAGLSQPELVGIANNVIETQRAEIDQMLEWRRMWYGSDQIDPNAGETLGMSMEDMGMTNDPAAVGSADDIDAMFATMMIDHHNGAIQMAEMALERGDHQDLRDLAQRIIDAQQAEIETMMPHADSDMHDMDG